MNAVCFARDGLLLASGGGTAWGKDYSVRLWDVTLVLCESVCVFVCARVCTYEDSARACWHFWVC